MDVPSTVYCRIWMYHRLYIIEYGCGIEKKLDSAATFKLMTEARASWGCSGYTSHRGEPQTGSNPFYKWLHYSLQAIYVQYIYMCIACNDYVTVCN